MQKPPHYLYEGSASFPAGVAPQCFQRLRRNKQASPSPEGAQTLLRPGRLRSKLEEGRLTCFGVLETAARTGPWGSSEGR